MSARVAGRCGHEPKYESQTAQESPEGKGRYGCRREGCQGGCRGGTDGARKTDEGGEDAHGAVHVLRKCAADDDGYRHVEKRDAGADGRCADKKKRNGIYGAAETSCGDGGKRCSEHRLQTSQGFGERLRGKGKKAECRHGKRIEKTELDVRERKRLHHGVGQRPHRGDGAPHDEDGRENRNRRE